MKSPTEISIATISRAITCLREKLGLKTQLPFAKILDCQPGALARWERGESIPSGDWMLKILALCPDEETRANFFIDIGEVAGKIPFIPRSKMPKEDKETPLGVRVKLETKNRVGVPEEDMEVIRYFNNAAMGLNVLFDAAAAGHDGARQELKDLADRISSRAGDWRRIKNMKKGAD